MILVNISIGKESWTRPKDRGFRGSGSGLRDADGRKKEIAMKSKSKINSWNREKKKGRLSSAFWPFLFYRIILWHFVWRSQNERQGEEMGRFIHTHTHTHTLFPFTRVNTVHTHTYVSTIDPQNKKIRVFPPTQLITRRPLYLHLLLWISPLFF